MLDPLKRGPSGTAKETEVKQGKQDMKKRRTKIFKNLLLAALFTITLISSAGAAHAALSIDYTIGGSGSISYDPTINTFLNGNALTVTGVTGNYTQSNTGTMLPVTSGLLNFQTGALTSQTGNVWYFNSGGTITLQGGISALNLQPSTTLLSGNFLSASVTELALGSFQFDIVGAALDGAENPNIYQYYGIPAGYTSSLALNLSFLGMSNTGGGFTSTNNFGGVVVDAPTPTPIPAAAWLFGSGLIGLGGIRRKMKKVEK
jgi:hypothetical protein